MVVVRERRCGEFLREGIEESGLRLDPISPDRVVLSQDAGLRQRQDGLAYRSPLKARDGQWMPPKRVKANKSRLSVRRKMKRLNAHYSLVSLRFLKSTIPYRLLARAWRSLGATVK